jgi:GNAT superfamily N-acetyltransferase
VALPHRQTLQVQSACVDDLDVVAALLRMQYDEHGIAVAPARLTEAVRAMLLDPACGAILLARHPKVVGLVVLSYVWTLEHGGRTAWVDEVFVAPTYRGRGVGRLLLRVALAVAQKAGCRIAQLEVVQGHKRAERLYQREGFTAVARRRWNRTLSEPMERTDDEQSL